MVGFFPRFILFILNAIRKVCIACVVYKVSKQVEWRQIHIEHKATEATCVKKVSQTRK